MGSKSGAPTIFQQQVQQAIECPPTDKSFVSIHDDEQHGLLVRVYKSGHAAYYCYLYDAVAKKKTYEKVADYHNLPLAKARRAVADRIERVAGKSADTESFLHEKKQQTATRKVLVKRSTMTLRRALEQYLATKGLADASRQDYRNSLTSKRNSADVLDTPIAALTLEWFNERFATIYQRSPAIAFKWRRYLHAVLSATSEAHPDLISGKLPVARKRSLNNYKEPPRKSNRLEATFFPELRKRLLDADEYDRDYILIMLFTGMRSGAVMRLRYDMTCNRPNQGEWAHGIISVYDATEKRPARDLVVSDHVRRIIIERHAKFGHHSPWLFWSKRFHAKHPEKHCGNDEDIFTRLAATDNVGEHITAHDLRRTHSYISRAVMRIDPVIVARLHLQSTNNMSVPDGYVSPSNIDLRREANRIAEKIHAWMKSTPEVIELEISGGQATTDVPVFEL